MSIALAGAGTRRSYGHVAALNDVSFELHTGELLGLFGPNGAGKSTLFREIRGRVQLNGGALLLRDTSTDCRR